MQENLATALLAGPGFRTEPLTCARKGAAVLRPAPSSCFLPASFRAQSRGCRRPGLLLPSFPFRVVSELERIEDKVNVEGPLYFWVLCLLLSPASGMPVCRSSVIFTAEKKPIELPF